MSRIETKRVALLRVRPTTLLEGPLSIGSGCRELRALPRNANNRAAERLR